MDRQDIGELELVHFSPRPIYGLQSKLQDNLSRESGMLKPHGFWVSVDGEDGWEDWCRENKFMLKNLKYKYRVKLNRSANLLYITDEKELDEFSEKFSAGSLVPEMLDAQFLRGIDWVLVASLYQGVLIIPYLWSRRLGGQVWYYVWDCASGCIWDASAIESIEKVARGY